MTVIEEEDPLTGQKKTNKRTKQQQQKSRSKDTRKILESDHRGRFFDCCFLLGFRTGFFFLLAVFFWVKNENEVSLVGR